MPSCTSTRWPGAWARSPSTTGRTPIAARFDGAEGAAAATIDGDPGGAWVVRGRVRAAFAFHVEDGLIQEIELIADPDVLATMDIAAEQA